MKLNKPRTLNIWVYHRKDSMTTLGEYHNARRRVFTELDASDTDAVTTEADRLCGVCVSNNYMLALKGDPFPQLEYLLHRGGVLAESVCGT